MIDATTRGTLNIKMPEAAMELFEEMAINNYQWHNSRAKPSKQTHVYDMDVVTTLAMQVETLSKKIDRLSITKQLAHVMQCDICGGGHGIQEC